MLVERPFMGQYACAQQGSYLRHQRDLGLQLAIEKLKQFPLEQRYNEVQEDKFYKWQPLARVNNYMASTSPAPINYIIKPSLISEGPAYKRKNDLKRPVYRCFPKIKQEVSAFGPKHAEHARRFYQSKRTQSIQKYQTDMVPRYLPNYESRQVSFHKNTRVTEGGYLLGEPVADRSVKTALHTDSIKGQVPGHFMSQPYETVLKVAKISPRPSKKQLSKSLTSNGLGVKLLKHKVEAGIVRKCDVFQDSGSEVDLSNAPVFQILCEMSNTL